MRCVQSWSKRALKERVKPTNLHVYLIPWNVITQGKGDFWFMGWMWLPLKQLTCLTAQFLTPAQPFCLSSSAQMAWGFYFWGSRWQQDLCPVEVAHSPCDKDCGRRVGMCRNKELTWRISLTWRGANEWSVQRDLANAERSALREWRRPLNREGSQEDGTEKMEKEG